MNGALARIRSALSRLKASERKVAEYILANPSLVVMQSVSELSEQCGASQAAVIRMCKSLGYRGFPELKVMIAGDLQQTREDDYRPLDRHASLEEAIDRVTGNNMLAVRDSVHTVCPKALAAAVTALYEADRIFIYGIGSSHLIGLALQQQFIQINKACIVFPDIHMQLASSVTVRPGDVALGISWSGETREVIRCIRNAREMGVRTVGITRFGGSSLSREAEIVLALSVAETDADMGTMGARIAMLNMIDVVYQVLVRMDYDHSAAYVDRTNRELRQLTGDSA